MERISIENPAAELEQVMQRVKWVQGLTVEQALAVAKIKQEDQLRNYRYWAQRADNDAALNEARARCRAAQYVVDVLELGVQPAPVERGRCPHYKAIRRAFAIAVELGFDTKADARMRRAFAMFLHRDVPSRESLSGGEWMLIGDAMKRRQLAW